MQKILVVDDQLSMRRMYQKIFEESAYSVDYAVDGKDGFKHATSTSYNLIITDYVMPKIDGIQLVRRLKTLDQYQYIPILIASTKSNSNTKQLGKDAGACGWIVKPIDAELLLRGIKRLAGFD
ncbi:hypothetical protein MNBD_GAMMA12-3930 [hydrothermal vent metagenome]|uniref:Response regulatory domain-containing protein n=1 Tax=hydrothermal vent metagenome TaxID=652676 RepID=A0A3B0YU26_9ZZZZ